MTCIFSLKDWCPAPDMLAELRRIEAHRQRWIHHFDEKRDEKGGNKEGQNSGPGASEDNKPWKPTEEEPGPRELIWELGWRLRARGPKETDLALEAGLVPMMCKLMLFTAHENKRFAKYSSRYPQILTSNSIIDIKEIKEGELAVNVLFEAARWPAGARALASSPELLDTIYASDGGLLSTIGGKKNSIINFKGFGLGPGRHACCLIDLLGRTLSTLLQEKQKGDREIARRFATVLTGRTMKIDGPKSAPVTALDVFKADSTKRKPPLKAALESLDIQPILPEQLTAFLQTLDAAVAPSLPSPLPIYTSWYRMEIFLDIKGTEYDPEALFEKIRKLQLSDPRRLRMIDIFKAREEIEKQGRDTTMVIPCDSCGAIKREMLRCTRCKGCRCCNKECQLNAWKEHKPHCTVVLDKSKGLLKKAMERR